MTEEKDSNGFDAGAAEATGQATVGEGQESAAPQETVDPVAQLTAENGELRDRFLRLAAEMENLRRRTERDVKDARSYAVTAFARDMLSVADDLRRGIDTVPAERRDEADTALTALIEGVELTERSMLAALERHGVRRIDAEGARFDPNLHQAMFEIPNDKVPHNTVLQVVQAGYAIADRVLRPALVGVSKGGPKQTAPTDGNGSGEPTA